MFRFSQKLREILRDLTSDEQAQLDRYDLELEDALSGTAASTDLWNIVAPDKLEPTTVPTSFNVETTSGITLDPGTDLSVQTGTDFNADTVRDVNLTIGRDFNVSAVGDATIQGDNSAYLGSGTESISMVGGNVLVGGLPTSDPGVPGALYNVLGVVHISL